MTQQKIPLGAKEKITMTKGVDIINEVVPEFSHGNADVGTSEVVLIANAPAETHKGVMVRAPGVNDDTPNTAVVYVGRSGLTADSDNGTGGWPIPPGETVTIPVTDPETLFTISGTASQKLSYWIM